MITRTQFEQAPIEKTKWTDVEYRIIGGTAYHADTPYEVVDLLDTYMHNGTRIRIFYGDVKTGKDWMEEHDTMGRIGRSTGELKVPLIINSARSFGGGALLDNRIVRITVDKQDVYKHPKYHTGTIDVSNNPQAQEYDGIVWVNGEVHAQCHTYKQADNLAKFYRGERNRK
jgi:hypothetical protein